jgi:hypothetical protein
MIPRVESLEGRRLAVVPVPVLPVPVAAALAGTTPQPTSFLTLTPTQPTQARVNTILGLGANGLGVTP